MKKLLSILLMICAMPSFAQFTNPYKFTCTEGVTATIAVTCGNNPLAYLPADTIAALDGINIMWAL